MTALALPPMPKATRKAPPGPKLKIARGVPLPKVPTGLEAAGILSAAPMLIHELPTYLDALSDTQLKCGWKAVIINAFYEEMASNGVYPRKETMGMIAAFSRSLAIVHERLVP